MHHSNRREFLKTATVTGLAASAGLAADAVFTREVYAAKKGKYTLRFRRLGKTDMKVTEVGFGVMNTRDPELLKAGLDAGINWFDTSHSYMRGVNEEVLGKVLKDYGRNKVYVATKIRCDSPEPIRPRMETSLRRLQTDHVDILFMHMPNATSQILNEEHMRTFEQIKKDGLARYIGVSIHEKHVELSDAITNSRFWEALLIGYSYKSGEDVSAAIARARKAGLAVIAMKTQEKGKGYPDHGMGNISEQQAALRWVLQNKYIDTAIPGMTNFEQLEEDLAVMGMKFALLDTHEIRHFAQAPRDGYCRGVSGCTGCEGQCPYGVNIREINRCLGYEYGYRNHQLARENYDAISRVASLEKCAECGDVCTVSCVNGLDLAESVRRARNLFA